MFASSTPNLRKAFTAKTFYKLANVKIMIKIPVNPLKLSIYVFQSSFMSQNVSLFKYNPTHLVHEGWRCKLSRPSQCLDATCLSIFWVGGFSLRWFLVYVILTSRLVV